MDSFTNGPWNKMEVTDRTFFTPRVKELTTLSYLNNLSEKTKEAVKYLWVYGNKVTTLNGIENFSNLRYINVFGNSLSDINGLKNSKKIEYLRLADNNFNDNELKQDNETDSLYVLQNLKELIWLDMATNSGIKHISYLSRTNKIKIFIYGWMSKLI